MKNISVKLINLMAPANAGPRRKARVKAGLKKSAKSGKGRRSES